MNEKKRNNGAALLIYGVHRTSGVYGEMWEEEIKFESIISYQIHGDCTHKQI